MYSIVCLGTTHGKLLESRAGFSGLGGLLYADQIVREMSHLTLWPLVPQKAGLQAS